MLRLRLPARGSIYPSVSLHSQHCPPWLVPENLHVLVLNANDVTPWPTYAVCGWSMERRFDSTIHISEQREKMCKVQSALLPMSEPINRNNYAAVESILTQLSQTRYGTRGGGMVQPATMPVIQHA